MIAMAKRPDPAEDWRLHDAIRIAVLAGRLEVKTDGLHLHKPDSPLYVAWDHLAPLLVLMVAALLVLLLGGLAMGLVAMTLAILAYIFGMRWWINVQIQRRALDAMLRNAHNWNVIWEYGGVALVLRGDFGPPCIAPACDWRIFARRIAEPVPLADAVPPPEIQAEAPR